MGRYAQLSQDTLNQTIDQLFLKTDDSYQSEAYPFWIYFVLQPFAKVLLHIYNRYKLQKIESNRIESNRVDVIFGESPITSEVYCYSLHESDVGFVVIVDRREDRWTSVKTLLLRISVCELLLHVIQQLSWQFAVFSTSLLKWGGSVAVWLACWTHEQKGPGSNRSRDAVGYVLAVHTHRASVHQAAKLVAALLRVARVTAEITSGK